MTFNEEDQVPIAELAPRDGAHLHRRFLDYWLRLRGGHAMPSYADIDPVDFPWALPNIFVVEALPGGDFVYRLAGEEHTQRYRRNLKGMRLSDIMQSDAAEAISERWRRMFERPAAFFILTDHKSEQGASVLGERLVLPLGNDRSTPTHLVGITNFLSTSSFSGSLTGDQRSNSSVGASSNRKGRPRAGLDHGYASAVYLGGRGDRLRNSSPCGVSFHAPRLPARQVRSA